MNTYLDFEQGEISIYLAGDALANLQCSLAQAEAIRRDSRRGAVLYVNTSFTARKFRAGWRECIRGTDGIFSLDCDLGELLSEFGDMKEMVRKYNIRQIIINNWEYGFKDYRSKIEAIFGLRKFLNMEVSLLIYAQANPDKARAGKIMRGSLGLLSGLAVAIYNLTKGEKEAEKIQENVKLVGNKINDLDTAQEPLVAQEKEESGTGVFSVNEGGLISHNKRAKHLPMSNTNRKLLADYEMLHGKAQLPGESFRDMFDRVVGKMIAEKAGMREMVEA
jgi:hypothetical protein